MHIFGDLVAAMPLDPVREFSDGSLKKRHPMPIDRSSFIGLKPIQESNGIQPADAEGDSQVDNHEHQGVTPHDTDLP